MKKLKPLFLALLLSLSLLTPALASPVPPPPEPDPTPVVTVQPVDPEGPGIMPQNDMPDPAPVEYEDDLK